MLFLSVVIMPIIGHLADQWGKDGAEWWMVRAALGLAILSPPLFHGLSSGNYLLAAASHAVATLLLCAYTAPLGAWLVQVLYVHCQDCIFDSVR